MKNSLTGSKKRIGYIDLYRCAGIVLMVMGHIGFGMGFDHFIHAFHMPMFFFMSGYFYRGDKVTEKRGVYITHKMRNLLVPYIAFGLLQYFIWLVVNAKLDMEKSWETLCHLLFINTDGLPIAGALWFLTSLFIVEVCYYLLDRYIKNRAVLTTIIICLAFLGTCVMPGMPVRLPWAMDASMVGILFYHIARMLKCYSGDRFIDKLFHMNLAEGIILTGLCVVSIFFNGEVNMRTGSYATVVVSLLNAVVASLLLWNLAQFVYEKLQKTHLGKEINKNLEYIGKNSIVYVCLNQLVILGVHKGVGIFGIPVQGNVVIILILTMIALQVATYIIINTKLCCLIGR